jgi:hypothetical protein
MPANKFYPPITAIVPVEALPNELGFIKSGLTTVLSRIYFKDLQYSHNDRGDSAFYNLSIVTLDRLDIEIPGTGLFLILNPAHDPAAGFSEFPIRVSYRWPILGYLRQFSLETFSFQPADIFDLALRVVGLTEREVVERALQLFVPTSSPVDTFVDDLNTRFGTSIAHPAAGSPDPLSDVLDEIETTAGIDDAGAAVFLLYLFDALSEDATRERIVSFFENLLDGGNIEKYIENLITPKIDATLELGLAIEFPRNVLEPLDAVGGKPLTDATIKTWLTFDAGSLFFSSDGGIGFDQVLLATLNHPSQIAGTGFGISLNQAKLDISRTTNIPEADADGRPPDFVGVYISDATISFPAAWNHDSTSTGVIKGKNLLIGTGGISGTLGLEAVSAGNPAPVVEFKFGKDFSISLDKFSITFKQNAITDSVIEGTLVIPGFKDKNDKPAEIRIKVDIRQDGDFDIAAHEDQGFKPIRLPGVFDLTLKSVYFGKKDDDFYLGVSGSITFTHPLLAGIAKSPIEIEKLIIWSDGRFEIEGGTIPLPQNLHFPIGPAELSISAIHLGSYQRIEANGTTTNFRFFGFDGGIDINPGGVDVRGKGIKFYFPVNGDLSLCYLEIKSLAIDLIIPGSASKETATLLIAGYLSIDGTASAPEYEGGVTFALPKVKIAGGAAMKYRPKVPAFLVDAFVELSTPIPLGATSLGIFGFRGIFGQRYIATKTKAGVKETDTWFDFYKIATPPIGKEGLTISKFEEPGQTAGYESTMSIGAGISLATAQDSGKTFSSKLFLLLSLPDLIYLEGRANILGPRVGLTGDDPPFSAVLAISSQSIEAAVGVNYKLPRDGDKKGQILDLNAEMRAAFFFQNSSAWYINLGTVEKPTTARVLTLFDATSYLTLSASGMAAGAGVTWGFKKSYAGGMVRASVSVYIKVGGFISFERPQIGGFAMLGGHVDVSLFGIGFYVVLGTSLSVEVPKPFYIEGSVHLCVGVTIGFWKFKKHIEKCFDVEFRWEKDSSVDTSSVLPFRASATLPPASALNMLSGETFNVAYLGTSLLPPATATFDQAVLPLDSWVDIEFLKGLLPGPSVDARIGRLSGQAPANAIDYIPPAEVAHKVTHQYAITALEINAWNGTAWSSYRPYEAMSPPAALAALAANPSTYKDGFWQNTGSGFNKVRLLAETSLSYMAQGQPGWYVPEQMGITSATLFCRDTLRDPRCIDWTVVPPGTVYPDGKWQQMDTVLYCLTGGAGTVLDWKHPNGVLRSLAFPNEATAQIVFNKPCAEVTVKLTTFSSGATIRFYKRETVGPAFVYTLAEMRTLTQVQLLAPVHYRSAAVPVAKVEIDPIRPDPAAVATLRVQIDSLYRNLYEGTGGVQPAALLPKIRGLEQDLDRVTAQGCMPDGISSQTLGQAIPGLQQQSAQCLSDLAALEAEQTKACREASELHSRFARCFPRIPSKLSYDIVEERAAGRLRFFFRIYDDDVEAILLNGIQRFDDASAAEMAMADTIALSRGADAYIIVVKDRLRLFQIVDASGHPTAASATLFTADQVTAFIKKAQAAIEAAYEDGRLTPVRRVNGMLPCLPCPDHLDSWSELPAFGLPDICSPPSVYSPPSMFSPPSLGSPTSARDVFCRHYNTFYRALYAHTKQLLDEATRHCDELTKQAETKRAECKELADRLTDLLILIGLIVANGPLRPPDGAPCSTLLHEACGLSFEDYQFNVTVPSQTATAQDYQSSVQAIEKSLTPLWRPDTTYSIRLQVSDTVNGTLKPPADFYFGFRTAGPVGYFDTDPAVHYVAAGKKPDQYLLTGLKGYIDYRRSYPNADGELVRAKPLFYEDARILLFFTKRYVYHFFGDWPAYNGLPAITGSSMQVVIKDPAEKLSIPNPPPPSVTTTEIPRATVSWPLDDRPRLAEDVRTLGNLRNPELLNPTFAGPQCWTSGGDMIKPASVYTSVTPHYLKPLKLYTAIVNNVYKGQTRKVHEYVFQTSRYPDFTAQVRSYRLDDGKGNQRDAVFRIDAALSAADLDLMFDIVSGNSSPANAALAGTYADPFDRLVQAAMKLTPPDAALGTEFNVVRNSTTGAVVAIWIRNPEPFNDPKLPDDVLPRTLTVLAGSTPDPAYTILFSKDRSQAFVMHPSKSIPATQLKFRFAYVEWDGADYVDRTVVITGFIDVSN